MASQGKFKNLLDMVQQAVKNFPDRKLFGVKKAGRYEWTTYREFGVMLDEVRGGLAHCGVGEGAKVAAILDNSPEWAAGNYACHGLGAAFVPMYERQNPKDWEYIIQDSGAMVVLVGDATIANELMKVRTNLPHLAHVIVVRGDAPEGAMSFTTLRAQGRENPREPIPVDDIDRIATLIYTSGTTGTPKGVVLSHANLTSNVNAVHEIFPIQADDVSLSFLPWAHSFGQTCELHCMISLGASMGLAENVTTIIDNLSEVRPTLLFSVPRIWNKIYDGLKKKIAKESPLKRKLMNTAINNAAELKRRKAAGDSGGWPAVVAPMYEKLVLSKIKERLGGRMRFAFSGGAALSKEVAQFIDNLGIVVYEGYGLTETSPISNANCPGAQRIGSVGRALPGVTVTIDTTAADGLEPGVGEILIAGPNIMQGYHNLPDKTAEVLSEDGTFRTGDLGRIDADGYLFITGRVKEQYKLENGKYVAPAPLEEKLKLSPFIVQVMIHGQNLPYNVAVIVPDFEYAAEWATASGLSDTSPAALAKNSAFKQRVMESISEFSSDFKGFERVKDILIVTEDFTTDNDMLTPSLKVKRRNVMKAYGDALLALYPKEE